MVDYILNGVAHGSVAKRLMKSGFDVNALRPYIGDDGRSYVTMQVNGEPTAVPLVGNNATDATLRIRQWQELDETVIDVSKQRLIAFNRLRSYPGSYTIRGGLGKTILQHQTMSDISRATISMDGKRRSESDRPVFDTTNFPLPIIHKDFEFGIRELDASQQNGGDPLDTSTARLAIQRCAEEVEFLTLGLGTFSYGGGTIYGFMNYPQRITRVITSPEASGWTPATLIQEVMQMRQDSKDAFHYGPWDLYMGTAWDTYLDDDYKATYNSDTLRSRIKMINGIQEIISVDYISGYDAILVQRTPDVARPIIAMDMTVMEWASLDGMQMNYKVMCMLYPQLRCDHNGNTGIVHGSPA